MSAISMATTPIASTANSSIDETNNQAEVVKDKRSRLLQCSSHIQEKSMLLLAMRSPSELRRLSKNIVREVCSYLSKVEFLAAVQFNTTKVTVHFLDTNDVVNIDFDETFPGAIAYCFINSTQFLCVGGSACGEEAKICDLVNATIERVAPMKAQRKWPGIAHYSNYAYVFGGNTEHMLNSAEKFNLESKTWSNCADMHTSKVCFTACVYKDCIYLPETDSAEKQLEVYTPATDSYYLLPLTLGARHYGSVSFIVQGQLFLLNYSQKAYSWWLDSSSAKGEELSITIGAGPSAFTNSPPVVHKQCVYWSQCSGKLTKLSLCDMKLYEPSE